MSDRDEMDFYGRKNSSEARGSPFHIAPEVLTRNSFDSKSDVYSFGIMMYELLMNKMDDPFDLFNRKECHVCEEPFDITEKTLNPLRSSKLGLVIDSSFEISGAARSIAYELSDVSGYPVKALGLKDHTKCLCEPYKNKAPDVIRICDMVETILKSKESN